MRMVSARMQTENKLNSLPQLSQLAKVEGRREEAFVLISAN
jgi:hypothetical protein